MAAACIHRVPEVKHKQASRFSVAEAFSYSTLSKRNLKAILLRSEVRFPMQAGNLLLATSVAWARVEAGRHFPSDVLAGAALGHFLSVFVHDAFPGLPEDERFGIDLFPHGGRGDGSSILWLLMLRERG